MHLVILQTKQIEGDKISLREVYNATIYNEYEVNQNGHNEL